jgi:hypothetical protein
MDGNKQQALGIILQDREASVELHKFLLNAFEIFDEDPKKDIPVPRKTKVFQVQIVKLNPAPPIPDNKPKTHR